MFAVLSLRKCDFFLLIEATNTASDLKSKHKMNAKWVLKSPKVSILTQRCQVLHFLQYFVLFFWWKYPQKYCRIKKNTVFLLQVYLYCTCVYWTTGENTVFFNPGIPGNKPLFVSALCIPLWLHLIISFRLFFAFQEPPPPGGNLLKPHPPTAPPDMSPFFLRQYVKVSHYQKSVCWTTPHQDNFPTVQVLGPVWVVTCISNGEWSSIHVKVVVLVGKFEVN